MSPGGFVVTGSVALGALIGTIVLAGMEREIPAGIPMIAAFAVGGLAAILSRSASQPSRMNRSR